MLTPCGTHFLARGAPPSVLPDISPTRGEISLHRAPRPLAAPAIGRAPGNRVISPRVGEMSGRTEGGAEKMGLDPWAPNSKRHDRERKKIPERKIS